MRKWILLLFLGLFLNAWAPENPYDKIEFETYFDYYKKVKSELKDSDFTFEGFQKYLILRNVSNREIVIAQAKLESGLFMSPIFYENNNLFGMKEPRIRETTATGTNRGHATYDHWVDSVDDYILWYNYVTRNRSYTDYIDFLYKVGYAEDPYYLQKLIIVKNSYNT